MNRLSEHLANVPANTMLLILALLPFLKLAAANLLENKIVFVHRYLFQFILQDEYPLG